jgi:hypothetical protein
LGILMMCSLGCSLPVGFKRRPISAKSLKHPDGT